MKEPCYLVQASDKLFHVIIFVCLFQIISILLLIGLNIFSDVSTHFYFLINAFLVLEVGVIERTQL